MEYKIRDTYDVSQTWEILVHYSFYDFLIIYGRHVNGGFIAIPDWGVCVEAELPTDVDYNAEKLMEQFENPGISKALAEAIKEHWESMEKTSPDSTEKTAKVKDKHIAERCLFQGKQGYIVSLIRNGEKGSGRFVPESEYEAYCKEIGVQPEIGIDSYVGVWSPFRK